MQTRNVLTGLSPRVRGNPPSTDTSCRSVGSIPACAGEPIRSYALEYARRVYPRVCGGTSSISTPWLVNSGLSPRVRGNLPRRPLPRPCHGSIPACAGEPLGMSKGCRTDPVYPRVCGGTFLVVHFRARVTGLSPRVRGNPWAGPTPACALGSIPACAGEPNMLVINSSQTWVYPRVCGGTSAEAPETALTWGLSPRVRGNHAEPVRDASLSGSIPACAGEPPQYVCRGLLWGVYPRVCGGTLVHVCRLATIRGLSPRVRGNPAAHHRRLGCCGSIPACAGEPRSGLPRGGLRRVYPRVCGGTPVRSSPRGSASGLSPRVRGNPRERLRECRGDGSIPACAGEPSPPSGSGCTRWVYPRVCGGTGHPRRAWGPFPGLSPRVRGNPEGGRDVYAGRGSIPACAGEPSFRFSSRSFQGVYPRVCGGTAATFVFDSRTGGLSPRVRGNPRRRSSASRL